MADIFSFSSIFSAFYNMIYGDNTHHENKETPKIITFSDETFKRYKIECDADRFLANTNPSLDKYHVELMFNRRACSTESQASTPFLPKEIWQEIASYLNPKSAFALRQVCKSLSEIRLPDNAYRNLFLSSTDYKLSRDFIQLLKALPHNTITEIESFDFFLTVEDIPILQEKAPFLKNYGPLILYKKEELDSLCKDYQNNLSWLTNLYLYTGVTADDAENLLKRASNLRKVSTDLSNLDERSIMHLKRKFPSIAFKK